MSMQSPGSGNLELTKRVEALERNSFVDRGRTTDPDTIEIPGMYHIYAGTIHAPESGNGYIILHFSSGGRIAQIAIINSQTNNYYIRTKAASQTSYSAWRKITTTEI